ncbi:MAG: hypothetical protein AAGA99_26260 [Actinomycetota bacterium]
MARTYQIRELLSRRPDLSTFLVHLTKSDRGNAAGELSSILRDRQLLARHSPTLMNTVLEAQVGRLGDTAPMRRNVVCMTDTPLDGIWMMCQDIESRGTRLQPFGLVFTRAWGRRSGVNPVFYVDQTPGHPWLTVPMNRLAATLNDKQLDDLAAVLPFVETMGPGKDFAWEREWRHVGDLPFELSDIVAVIAPEDWHQHLASTLQVDRPWIDPEWSLQRMIAALAGVPWPDADPMW